MAGRRPKLSEAQRQQVATRYAAGETLRSLAAEFGVSQDTILRNSERAPLIREMAQKVASVETELATLHPRDQASVRTLAEQLKETSHHLARAAVAGAATSAKLAQMAQTKAEGLGPKSKPEDIRDIAALAATGNEAAKVALQLLQANRGTMQAEEDRAALPREIQIVHVEVPHGRN